MSAIDDLIEAVQFYGVEKVFKRYYGFYESMVVSNKDPEERGRIQVVCPGVGHSEKDPPNVWVRPSLSGAGLKHGDFHPPEKGDSVYVTFEQGDPNRPQMYMGGWYGKDDLHSDLAYSEKGYPERRGIITRGGHQLIFSDEDEKQFVRLMWHQPASGDESLSDRSKAASPSTGGFASLSFNEHGDAFISNKDSSYIHLDAKNDQASIVMQAEDGTVQTLAMTKKNILIMDGDANVIEISKANKAINVITKGDINLVGERINLKGGTVFIADQALASAVLGEVLVAYLAAHVHAAPVPGGFTGPPAVPPPPAILSQKVKLG